MPIIYTEGSVAPMSHNSIHLDIPSKYKLQSYQTQVMDDKTPWTSPEVAAWCAWDFNKTEFTPDGGVKISLGLNNWSGDRVRSIRIVADVT